MVKSAYSSGRPSFGVGAGNVPVIIDRDANLKDAAEKIVAGASFDNGIICSHEQFVLTAEEQYPETIRSFQETGKVWYTDDPEQVQRLRDVVFPDGRLNKDVVGRSPKEVGALAGIQVPETARIILLPAKGAGTEDVLAKEKLCPVVAILAYKSFADAVAAAKANLLVEGAGHSAAVHSNTDAGKPSCGQPGMRAHRGRFALQRLRRHHHARVRLVGREFDFREPRLQASDERVADRQDDCAQEGADRRGDLGLTLRAQLTTYN